MIQQQQSWADDAADVEAGETFRSPAAAPRCAALFAPTSRSRGGDHAAEEISADGQGLQQQRRTRVQI